MKNLLNGILISNNTLPDLPMILEGGTIIDVAGSYYLVEAYSQLLQKKCFHIIQLTANRKGWFNGRYDIENLWNAYQKLQELGNK